MKKFCSILLAFLIFASCGTSSKIKESESSTNQKVLYSKFSKELNGNLEVILMNDTEIRCSANIIQITCSNFRNKDLLLTSKNGEVALKLLDEKSYYFTPSCDNKKVELVVHSMKNESVILAKISIYPKK